MGHSWGTPDRGYPKSGSRIPGTWVPGVTPGTQNLGPRVTLGPRIRDLGPRVTLGPRIWGKGRRPPQLGADAAAGGGSIILF